MLATVAQNPVAIAQLAVASLVYQHPYPNQIIPNLREISHLKLNYLFRLLFTVIFVV